MLNSADFDPISYGLTEPLDNTVTALGVDSYENVTAERDGIHFISISCHGLKGRHRQSSSSSHFCKPCQYLQFHAVRVIAVILAVTEEIIVIKLW